MQNLHNSVSFDPQSIMAVSIVHAPPVEGRANEALCEFLADRLDLPRRAITVLRGDTSRHKVLRISGLTLDAVKAALSS